MRTDPARLERLLFDPRRLRRCLNCRAYCIGAFCWDCVRSWIVGVGMALLVKWLVH